MSSRRFIGVVARMLLAFGLSLGSTSSVAVSSYLTAFTTRYPTSTTATVFSATTSTGSWSTSSARCNVCHSSGGGTDLNAFGEAFAAAGHTFPSIEPLNSDGSATDNLGEITVNAQPGWSPGPTNTLYDITNPGAGVVVATNQNPPSSLVGLADPAAPTTTTTAAPTTTTTTAAPTTTTTTAAPTTTTTTTAAATTTTTVASTTTTTVPQGVISVNLSQGWNLIGNSNHAPMDVGIVFGDATKVKAVYKWIANQAKWAFYSPSLGADALGDYARRKDYELLATINAGEGVWVNAREPFSINLPAGNAVLASEVQSTLTQGWNLISIGETMTPRQFNVAVGRTVTSLWAWDSASMKWYFYAPSLDDEIEGMPPSLFRTRGYIDFASSNKTLGAGVGFWVNAERGGDDEHDD